MDRSLEVLLRRIIRVLESENPKTNPLWEIVEQLRKVNKGLGFIYTEIVKSNEIEVLIYQESKKERG